MASKIEWTRNADGTQGRTWEPVLGCSSVSSGCTNCYAERLTWRLANNPVCGKRYRGLDDLVATPAAMHFVSYELAVEAVDFRPYLGLRCEGCGAYGRTVEWCRIGTGYDNGHVDGDMPCGPMTKETPCVDWVIAGGESGPHSRPCDVAWIRSVVKQCQAAETPVFVKQLGSNSVSSSDDDRRHCGDMTLPDGFRMIFRDRKGADPREWPEDLRIRQYPDVRR